MLLKMFKRKRQQVTADQAPHNHLWVKVGERLVDTGGYHCPEFDSYDVLYCPHCNNELTLSPLEARIELAKTKIKLEYLQKENV